MADSTETVLNRLMHEWNSALAWEMPFDRGETMGLAPGAPSQLSEMTRTRTPILYRGLPGDEREHSDYRRKGESLRSLQDLSSDWIWSPGGLIF